MPNLTEKDIAQRLSDAFIPGKLASTDGAINKVLIREPMKCAAVLIPMACVGSEWHILFTRRTEIVESHKGQVSFPGGACDDGETTPEETALREADEEIGLQPSDVHVLGKLNDIVTITQYRVTPVVGIFPFPYVFKVSNIEVGRVFTMPLQWLADRRNRWEFTRSETGISLIAYHPFDGEILWGATARMVVNFLEVLGFD